jgi:hypothetical protein
MQITASKVYRYGIDNHLLVLICGSLDGVPKYFRSLEKVIQERHGRISIQ